MGAGNGQVPFSSGHTQRALGCGFHVERYTPNDHVSSLTEFLHGLRESLGSSLRDLIAEHQGLKLWLGVDMQYRHTLDERVAVGHLTTHTQPSCTTTSRLNRCSNDWRRRCSSAMRTSCGIPARLYCTTSSRLSCMTPDRRQHKEVSSTSCPSCWPSRIVFANLKNDDNSCFGYNIIASCVPQDDKRHRNRLTV